jgi:cytochrome c-type biogenesis protein CcmF
MISITTYGLTDLYVFLEDWQGAAQATIHIYVNPLTVLVWFGGLVLILGGVVCWWPEPPTPLRSGRLARSLTIAVAEATTVSDRPPVQTSQALTDPVTGEASAQEKVVVASAQAVEHAATSPTPGPSDSRSRESGEEVSQ